MHPVLPFVGLGERHTALEWTHTGAISCPAFSHLSTREVFPTPGWPIMMTFVEREGCHGELDKTNRLNLILVHHTCKSDVLCKHMHVGATHILLSLRLSLLPPNTHLQLPPTELPCAHTWTNTFTTLRSDIAVKHSQHHSISWMQRYSKCSTFLRSQRNHVSGHLKRSQEGTQLDLLWRTRGQLVSEGMWKSCS